MQPLERDSRFDPDRSSSEDLDCAQFGALIPALILHHYVDRRTNFIPFSNDIANQIISILGPDFAKVEVRQAS
jgi:hypothetical protein